MVFRVKRECREYGRLATYSTWMTLVELASFPHFRSRRFQDTATSSKFGSGKKGRCVLGGRRGRAIRGRRKQTAAHMAVTCQRRVVNAKYVVDMPATRSHFSSLTIYDKRQGRAPNQRERTWVCLIADCKNMRGSKLHRFQSTLQMVGNGIGRAGLSDLWFSWLFWDSCSRMYYISAEVELTLPILGYSPGGQSLSNLAEHISGLVNRAQILCYGSPMQGRGLGRPPLTQQPAGCTGEAF